MRPYNQSKRPYSTVERLHLNRNWLLTGLFSSNPAVQIQLSVSLKKFGGSKIFATVQLEENRPVRGQFLFKGNLSIVDFACLDWVYVLARVSPEESRKEK